MRHSRSNVLGQRRLSLESLEARNLLSASPLAAEYAAEAHAAEFDFGDAPDSLASSQYPTLAIHDGARHTVVPGFSLGHWVDREYNGQPNAQADGDDAVSVPDDEDGVRFPAGLTVGESAAMVEVYVTDLFDQGGTAGGFLDAWIDFDGDGSWDDAKERIYAGAVAPGWNSITFPVPDNAQLGTTYARFRLNSMAAGLLPTGLADDGEVEDHRLSVYDQTPHVDLGDWVLVENASHQSIPVYVTGLEAVDGADLFVQVADGGPEASGLVDGPALSNVDILNGTIFEGNNEGETGAGQIVPQFWDSSTATTEQIPTVLGDGLLATITLDTTGFFAADDDNPWDLKLANTLAGDSVLLAPPPGTTTHITNGRITLNARPVADPGGPYTLGSGETITLDASNSFDPDATDGIVHYQWDLDGDGSFEVVSVGPTIEFSAAQLTAGAPYTVSLKVTDNHGLVSEPAQAEVALDGAPSLALSLVVQPSSLDDPVTGEVATLPASSEWFDEWTGFYAEVWVHSGGSAAVGVATANLDLNYQAACFSATSIEYGPAFELNQTGDVDKVIGAIESIGAETSATDVGDDRYALLARVRFEPAASGPGVDVDPAGPYATASGHGVALAEGMIGLVGLSPANAELAEPPATELWPVLYDTDDNGEVGFGDFAYFADVFLQEVGEAGATFAAANDFDHSGRVDFGDFALFAANFLKAKGDGWDRTYPANFPDAWRGEAMPSVASERVDDGSISRLAPLSTGAKLAGSSAETRIFETTRIEPLVEGSDENADRAAFGVALAAEGQLAVGLESSSRTPGVSSAGGPSNLGLSGSSGTTGSSRLGEADNPEGMWSAMQRALLAQDEWFASLEAEDDGEPWPDGGVLTAAMIDKLFDRSDG